MCAQGTTNPAYKKMYAQMMAWNRTGVPVLLHSNEEGLEKVASSDDYAFFMESVAIEYMMERNCNVTSVGSSLDEKGYGIAMAKSASSVPHARLEVVCPCPSLPSFADAPFRSALSAGVLRMQETGRMMEMKDKWWKNKRGGGACIVSNACVCVCTCACVCV